MAKLSERKPKRISIRVTPGDVVRVRKAVELVSDHYGGLAEVWPMLSEERRSAVLDHSPLLRELLPMLDMFGGA